jgi:site-specific DNA-methyltransferase (adenine-specific)
VAVLELLTIKIQQMTIENTNDKTPTTPAITYSECYQQCFCSDNLELMKTIESNTVDLIYCDILYGTGKKFKDYQDLKPIRSEIEQHYIPRIKEMHRILKPTGSVYLQMDTKINHWIRCLLDEIFGQDKFINEIIWQHQGSWKTSGITHQNIYRYSKGNKYIQNKIYIPYPDENGIKKRWNKFIVDGKITKNYYPKNDTKFIPYINNADGEIIIDFNKKEIGSVWNISNLNPFSRENTKYNTQKPISLIKAIVEQASNMGDLVADFYLGSGTTAEVCKDLNRNFIGYDINPRAVEITLKRLNDARS